MEIVFRGKRIDNGKWVEGDLIQLHDGRKYIVNNVNGACIDDKGNFINTEEPFVCQVDLATIGQYTGLKDKNGRHIFEGDIVRYSIIVRDCLLYQGILKVVFERGSFCMEETDSGDTHTLYNTAAGVELEVIGNAHDNPELLQEV